MLKGTGLVHKDGHHARSHAWSRSSYQKEKAHIGLGGGDFAASGRGFEDGLEGVQFLGTVKLLSDFTRRCGR